MTDDILARAEAMLAATTGDEVSADALFTSPDLVRDIVAALREARAEVERLEAWRAEALAMNARLQDLGIALGVALDSLDRVRKALSGHPACDVHPGDDPITCGWKRAVADIRRALDGAR